MEKIVEEKLDQSFPLINIQLFSLTIKKKNKFSYRIAFNPFWMW